MFEFEQIYKSENVDIGYMDNSFFVFDTKPTKNNINKYIKALQLIKEHCNELSFISIHISEKEQPNDDIDD